MPKPKPSLLQRGRAHGGADGRDGAARYAVNDCCFNGAALTGARMAKTETRKWRSEYPLQRGRAHGGADGALGRVRAHRRIARLQRGRAHGGADGPAHRLREQINHVASTGPRSRGRGWKPRLHKDARVHPSFNGAALTGARMVDPWTAPTKNPAPLQRGRAHGGADGPGAKELKIALSTLQRGRAHGGADGQGHCLVLSFHQSGFNGAALTGARMV